MWLVMEGAGNRRRPSHYWSVRRVSRLARHLAIPRRQTVLFIAKLSVFALSVAISCSWLKAL